MFSARRLVLVILLVLSGLATGAGLTPAAQAATVGLSHPQSGRIVSDDPANFTPHILNGTVYSIVQVGEMIVVGGSFTQVRSATNSTVLTRNRVFAFDATTGEISNAFNPSPNGTVYKVQQATDGTSAYVGGSFTSAGGAARRNLFKINVATGQVVTAFTPPTLSGTVRDLEVVGSRLWVAGKFTHIGSRAQKALGTLNATTGAYDAYFDGVMAGLHRTGAQFDATNVLQISSDPQNTELVAVGNFTSVDGQPRSQIAKLDISSPTEYALPEWNTNLFTQACSSKWETYMSDVEYSPNGQFLVVSTGGAYGGQTGSNNGTSGCDVVARWERGLTGNPNKPTWTAYTGGDSTWTVEVTDNVVYAGGHQRWQNNPNAGDKIGEGAVARTGIAALNPVNGMAYTWNPTRTRGVGIQDMLATSQGLWVGSDTDRIGNWEYHARIALMPLSGGKQLPPMVNATLPGTLYGVAANGSQLTRRAFDGSTTAGASDAPNGSVSWGSTVGAFMANGTLYTASSNGSFTKRTFNGSAYGPATPVDAADQLMYQAGWHGTDIPTMTSLFYVDGRMYFTRSGQNTLFRRGFETESDVVGQQRFGSGAVSGIPFSTLRGAFVAGNKFYYVTSTGQMYRADWADHAPVAGTIVPVLGGTGQPGASRVLFVYQGAGEQPNQPPTAVPDVRCTDLTCTFDSTGSTDDGTITARHWAYGDPGASSDSDGTYTYPTPGPRTVTLTVTDNDGVSGSATVNINPQLPAPPQNAAPTAVAGVTCDLLTCTFSSAGSNDSDGTIVSYVWNDGAGVTSTEPSFTHTYDTPGPRSVTLTVTDNQNATGTDTTSFNPSDTASPVTFVGVEETNANRPNHRVPVPADTQVGDTLLLFFAANTTTPTYTYPSDWTEVEALNGSGFVGRAFTKVATAADLGSTVQITSSGYAKSDMALAAYRGTDPADPIAVSAGALDNVSRAAHTSPTLTAPDGSSWLVTYWADKSSGTTGWTAPAGQTFRTSKSGTSSGHVSGLLVDSAADVSGGTGGLTATANSVTNRALSFSIVLR